ncbi:Hypothetical predicted protein [Paramuricea clavata]|uniref:Uncharacterized protein n=1 Tax=Paramuricea clavata TaxID=317549 RepID=A0A6S7K597_PARCT|nr:Hypothetical predicted protein [Paramuricea clavata]
MRSNIVKEKSFDAYPFWLKDNFSSLLSFKQFENIKSEKMVLAKALCVVLLLCSASSVGESRRLERDSDVEKRAVNYPQPPAGQPAEATRNAADLNAMVRRISGAPDTQMAFIYLHPPGANVLTLTNQAVRGTLNGPARSNRGLLIGDLYPPRPPPNTNDNTNFRMNFRGQRRQLEIDNTDHTEYKLLNNRGLEVMVQSMPHCPVYVILYSKLLPCSVGGNPNKPPRCLEMIATARRNIRTPCPNAQFYLYTTQNGPRTSTPRDPAKDQNYQRYFQTDMTYMQRQNIIWLHPL